MVMVTTAVTVVGAKGRLRSDVDSGLGGVRLG